MRTIIVDMKQALADALVLLNRTPSDSEGDNLRQVQELGDDDLGSMEVTERDFDKDDPTGPNTCFVSTYDTGEEFCRLLPYEGQTMRMQADAISRAGLTILALYRMAQRARPAVCVLHPWTFDLPRRMQAVLISATRGCDSATKEDPSKVIVRSLRAAILLPSNPDYDAMNPKPDDVNTFMAYHPGLRTHMRLMLGSLDQYPFHYVMHLLHAAAIVGYHHPIERVANDFRHFYEAACEGNLHTPTESQTALYNRLRDR